MMDVNLWPLSCFFFSLFEQERFNLHIIMPLLLYDFITHHLLVFKPKRKENTSMPIEKVLHALNLSSVVVPIDSHVAIKTLAATSQSKLPITLMCRQSGGVECVRIVFLTIPRKLPRWDSSVVTPCEDDNNREAKATNSSLKFLFA